MTAAFRRKSTERCAAGPREHGTEVDVSKHRSRRRLKTTLMMSGVCVTVVIFVLIFSYVHWMQRQPDSVDGTGDERWKYGGNGDGMPRQVDRSSGSVSDNFLVVEAAGSFIERVDHFNVYLDQLRRAVLFEALSETRKPVDQRQWTLHGWTDDYLEKLAINCPHTTTVVLPWLKSSASDPPQPWTSLGDTSNLLIQTYYEWTADRTLCYCIENRPYEILKHYDAVYNRKCNRNINDTILPTGLPAVFLNAKPILPGRYWPNKGSSYPSHFYTDAPPYSFLMHIHRHAAVTQNGDVIGQDARLVFNTCMEDVKPVAEINDHSPLYDELFVLTQPWGNMMYQRMAEVVPRLSLYLDFLRKNPEIRLYSPDKSGHLSDLVRVLGLNPQRIVTGGSVLGKVVYQPKPTGCGFPNVQETQTLSQLYHDYIGRRFAPQPRNRLVLIRRVFGGAFADQQDVEELVARAARDYNLTYAVFSEYPPPSLHDTMTMFHTAVLVVAPHGPALSNLVFSQPGTFVLEGVCEVRDVDLRYQWLAHILGHHWHGVTSRGGCPVAIHVLLADIEQPLRTYLEFWSQSKMN